jgi:antitoxin (DNA-binding transcriptional repressor) of toxin-antitoxin stability system
MAAYALAQAQPQLDRLVEPALTGEVVTITRDGPAVVTLTPAAQARSLIDAERLGWTSSPRSCSPTLIRRRRSLGWGRRRMVFSQATG